MTTNLPRAARWAGSVILLAVMAGAPAGKARAQSAAVRWTAPYAGQQLAVDPSTQQVFVLGDDGAITVLNAQTGARTRQVATGVGGSWGASLIDGQAGRGVFLSLSANGGGRLVLLDTHTDTVLATLSVPTSSGFLAEDRQAGRVYLPGSDPGGSIAVVDLRTGQAVDSLQAGAPAAQIAVDEAARRLIVVTGDVEASGGVQGAAVLKVLDLGSRAVVASVGIGRAPGGLALDPAAGTAIVSNRLDRTISVVDEHAGRLVATVAASLMPSDVLVDSAHTRAYVLDRGTGQGGGSAIDPGSPAATAATVDVLDTQSGAVLARVPVGTPATALALDRQRGALFVGTAYARPAAGDAQRSYSVSGSIRALALAGRPAIRTVLWPAGAAPAMLAPDELDGRVYVLSRASSTVSSGTVGGFVARLDESR